MVDRVTDRIGGPQVELNEILKCYKELSESVDTLMSQTAQLTLDTFKHCPEMMHYPENMAKDIRKMSDQLVLKNLEFQDMRDKFMKRNSEGEGWKS